MNSVLTSNHHELLFYKKAKPFQLYAIFIFAEICLKYGFLECSKLTIEQVFI